MPEMKFTQTKARKKIERVLACFESPNMKADAMRECGIASRTFTTYFAELREQGMLYISSYFETKDKNGNARSVPIYSSGHGLDAIKPISPYAKKMKQRKDAAEKIRKAKKKIEPKIIPELEKFELDISIHAAIYQLHSFWLMPKYSEGRV